MGWHVYCLYTFGTGGPGRWIIYSDAFQFLIYGILSYPFAWLINAVKDIKKKKKLKWIYILSCLILPLIYYCVSVSAKREYYYISHKLFIVFLRNLILLAFWVLRLWMILMLQIFIRKLGKKWGLWGTVAASIACAWILYKILEFSLPTILAWY